MRDHLLQWQLAHYPEAHTRRQNLILHAFTTPLFMVGTLLTLGVPAFPPMALLALPCVVIPLVAQGRGHRTEPTRPAGFAGAMDFVTRFIAEQWVTFPRFVLSGGFARAWRSASRRA